MEELDLRRPKFNSLCWIYALTGDDLAAIEESAGVSRYVMNNLYLGDPVSRASAEVVLAAFSARVGRTFTLENTTIPLIEEEGLRPS